MEYTHIQILQILPVFQKWLYQFALLPLVHENFSCSIFLSIHTWSFSFYWVRLNFNFLNDKLFQASFYKFIGHSNILFCEGFVKVFFFNWKDFLFVIECSLYIQEMNFILNICIENIFIHSVGFEKTIFFSFEVDKMLIMVQLNLTKFLMTYALYVIFKKIFATPIRKIFFCNFF